jgi:hypothetical protein
MPEDALLHQLAQRGLDIAGLPPVGQAGRQPPRQTQAVVEGFEQDGPAIRTRVGLVELPTMGCDSPWHSKVTCAIQSVAIEPPGVRATKRLDTASIAPLRGSVALLLHRSRIKRARTIGRGLSLVPEVLQ